MAGVYLLRVSCGPTEGCNGCGTVLRGRRTAWCSTKCRKGVEDNHLYTLARARTKRRDKYACVKCGSKKLLECNHIVPVNGKRESWSCTNHQSNLETLCHSCHQTVTAQQRLDGLIGGKRHVWVFAAGRRWCNVCLTPKPNKGSAGNCPRSPKLFPDRRLFPDRAVQ